MKNETQIRKLGIWFEAHTEEVDWAKWYLSFLEGLSQTSLESFEEFLQGMTDEDFKKLVWGE
jgi:hypothetical protein